MANNLLITLSTSKLDVYYTFSVAFEQNVIVYKYLTKNVCFDTMALLAWWSAAEAKLITKFNKKIYSITFCLYATQYT